VLIGGFGVLTGPDLPPEIGPADAGVLLLRPDGQDGPPHGSENRFAGKGLVVLIGSVAAVGDRGRHNGVVSVRAFSADALGDWEPFQADPAK
jgi:hypothetical protein